MGGHAQAGDLQLATLTPKHASMCRDWCLVSVVFHTADSRAVAGDGRTVGWTRAMWEF